MDVRLPDGRIIKNVPPGTTRSQLAAKLERNGISVPHTGVKGTGTYDLPAPKSDLASSYLSGGMLGGLDEVAGAAGAVADAIRSPFSDQVDFNPSKSYAAWRDRANQGEKATTAAHPIASRALGVAGALGNVPVKAIKATTLGKSVIKGAGIGGATGAAAGFLSGDGLDNRISGAEWGLGIGAPLGALAPLILPPLINGASSAAGAVKNAYNRLLGAPVKTAAQRAEGLGRKVVAKAMVDDAVTPLAAGKALDEARGRGVPLALGDMGDNLRGLAGSLSRKPGASRRLVQAMVDERQAGQVDRVRGAVERDLGPIANPYRQSDVIMNRAKMVAGPLYKKAYANPPINSPEIESLLSTPAGRKALNRAQVIAANERRDPTALGFALDDQGNVVLNPTLTTSEDEAGNLLLGQSPEQVRSFSPQTLDYVKRGLDDVVEANRDKVSRRLILDEAGRAENMVRGQFREEVKRLNPDYGAALNAYAGPASAKQAMETGRKALNYSDQEIERAVTKLSQGDRQQFALGFRTALADALDRRVDGADKVGALLGSPRKRKALAQVFGGEEGFNRFLQTMADERLANETYRAVRTGSPTAGRVAEDASTSDLLGQSAQAAYNIGRGNVPGLLRQGLGAFQDFRRFGAGQSAERAREEAAALLSETNPEALRKSLREALRNQALYRARLRTGRKAGVAGAVGAGQLTGSILGPAQ
jgi:hypothetical protein